METTLIEDLVSTSGLVDPEGKAPLCTLAAKIKSLHGELLAIGRNTVERAIEIGGLLAQAKLECQHGEWLKWLKKNVGFSRQTADNYLRLYQRREGLKLLNVGNLADAYRWASQSTPPRDNITLEQWGYTKEYVKELEDERVKAHEAYTEWQRKTKEIQAEERAAEEVDRKNNPEKYAREQAEEDERQLRKLQDRMRFGLSQLLRWENKQDRERAIEILSELLKEVKAGSFFPAPKLASQVD